MFASDTSMSTDIPREIRWSPRPGRPQVVPSWSSYFSLFLGHFWKFFLYNRIAPQTQPIERMKWRVLSPVVKDVTKVSNKMVSMVCVWTLCSLIWLLLLFTSNSDAVHPSAVYRSFHQNDHFTVPLPNSTLSAKCKAAYDKLRNPDSPSDVTELVACKFVRSARFFSTSGIKQRSHSFVPLVVCILPFNVTVQIFAGQYSTARKAVAGVRWAGTQVTQK